MAWHDELACPFDDPPAIAAFREGARRGAAMLERSWEWAEIAELAAAVGRGDYPVRLDEPTEQELRALIDRGVLGAGDAIGAAFRRGYCDAFVRGYSWVA